MRKGGQRRGACGRVAGGPVGLGADLVTDRHGDGAEQVAELRLGAFVRILGVRAPWLVHECIMHVSAWLRRVHARPGSGEGAPELHEEGVEPEPTLTLNSSAERHACRTSAAAISGL